MLRRYQLTIGVISCILDMAIVCGLWLASFPLRFYLPIIQVTKGFPDFSTYAAVTPLIAALWILVFNAQGVYQPKRRMAGGSTDALMLLKSHLTAVLCFVALSYIFSEYRYSRGVLIYFAVLGAVGLIGGRLLLRSVFHALRRNGFRTRKIILVGEAKSLNSLIPRLERFPELGLKILGVLVPESSATAEIRGKPVLGHFGNVASAIERTGAQQVLIAMQPHRWFELEKILQSIHDETIDIQIIPDVHAHATLGCQVENFDGLPILSLNDSPLRGWGSFGKRCTDVVLSLIGLLVLSPVLLLVALAVKLTSRGPMLYGQERMGLDGRLFRMLKFRSMRVDAEAETGAVWARKGDDRRTPIGALLRATSLDELPQLWNVLTGDMSLVGPRPERPVFVKQFRHEISHYMLRHKVKAGVTGWAQVNGWRGNTSLDERIRCDLDYIRNWSFFLDVRILFMTVWKGFVNRNAY